jgi:hypothetical protein
MVKLDYAPHYIEGKKELERTVQLILKNDYKSAVDHINLAIVELRMMKAAIISNLPDE